MPSIVNPFYGAINLFGRNVASYKFSWAKSLLELAKEQITAVTLKELAEPFLRHLCFPMKLSSK
jgi:hypothetical protein